MATEPFVLVAPVPDITSALLYWTHVRFYRATSLTGAASLLSTTALVAGQPTYTYSDTTADPALEYWYEWCYYNSGTTQESARSRREPYGAAPVLTRANLRQQLANLFGVYGRPRRQHTFPGASGTTTGAGTATTTVCSAYIGARWNDNAFRDWYLLGASGSEQGNHRQVSALDVVTGTFTHDAFGTGVGNAQTFELYGELTPEEWNECLDEGRRDVWTPTWWPVTGIASQTEYPLPSFLHSTQQVQQVRYQSGSTARQDTLRVGADYEVRGVEGGGTLLYLASGLAPTASLRVEAYRPLPKLVSDSDSLTLSEPLQRLLLVSAAIVACRRLEFALSPLVEDRTNWERRKAMLDEERQARDAEANEWKQQARVLRAPLSGYAGARGPRVWW